MIQHDDPQAIGDAAARWTALQLTAAAVHTPFMLGTDPDADAASVAPSRVRRLTRIAAAGTLALGALTATGLTPLPAQAMLTADSQLFSLTNQDRVSNGVPALQWNDTLGAVAENWTYTGCGYPIAGRAQDMMNRQYFAHLIPGCGNQYVFNMFSAAGLHYGWAGENIGWNNTGGQSASVIAVDQAFMQSPDHRANILSTNYTHMAMGSASGTFQGVGGASMYAQEFIQTTAYLPPQQPPSQQISPPSLGALQNPSNSRIVQLNWSNVQLPSPTYTVWVNQGGWWTMWTQGPGTTSQFIGLEGTAYGFAIEVSGPGYDSGMPTQIQQGTTVANNAPNPNAYGGLYAVDSRGALHEGFSSPLNTPIWNWDIVRGLAVNNSGEGGFTLDGYGGLHPFGNAGSSGDQSSHYWPGFDIARSVVLRADGVSGYVLDGYGGLHAFGGAPDLGDQSSHYWNGWDIARGVVLRADGKSGYVLDGWGGLHAFGGAPDLGDQSSHYWSGWDITRGVVLRANGSSGYVLDGFGGVHPFGGAPAVDTSGAYWNGWDIARGLTLVSSHGGYLVDGYGGFHAFGGAPQVQSNGYATNGPSVRGIGSS